MKKRYFLSIGLGSIGSVWLSGCLPDRSQSKTKKPKFEITKTEQEWRNILTPAQFEVLRQHGTERAGTSPLDNEHRQGTFTCAGCDLPLFASNTKYNSGTGWSSFYAPIEGAIGTTIDRAFVMTRIDPNYLRQEPHSSSQVKQLRGYHS